MKVAILMGPHAHTDIGACEDKGADQEKPASKLAGLVLADLTISFIR